MGLEINGKLSLILPVVLLVACDSSSTGSDNPEADTASTSGATAGNSVVVPQNAASDTESQPEEQSTAAPTTTANSSSDESIETEGGQEPVASVSSSTSLDFSDLPDSDLSVFVDADSHLCTNVGETAHLNVHGIVFDVNSGFDELDLTAHASLDLSEHPNVSVVSHSDDSISVSVNSRDIVDLTVYYENQFDRIFISALEKSTVLPVILKKHYQESRCSYALYTSAGCAVLTSDIGTVGAQSGGISIEVEGCDLYNPSSTPVITLGR